MRFMHNALSAIAGLMGCSSTTEYIDFGTSPVSNTLLFQVSILSMTEEQVCRCLEYNLNTGIVLCEDLGISDFSGSKSNYCRIPFSLLSVSSSEISRGIRANGEENRCCVVTRIGQLCLSYCEIVFET